MLKRLVYFLIIITLFFAVSLRLRSIGHSANRFWSTIAIILQNPFASYEDKMTMKYPRFFPFMRMISANTPQDSTIYLPRDPGIAYGEPMWPIANFQVVSALLYPRTIIAFSPDLIPQKDPSAKTFIIKFDPAHNPSEELIKL